MKAFKIGLFVAALFFCATILSCSEEPKGSKSTIFTERAVSDFIRIHQDWDENEKIKSETTEKFKHMMINLSNEPAFLKDMPFKLVSVTDTTINNMPYQMANFRTFVDPTRAENSLLNQLDLQVSGILPDKLAGGLRIDAKHIISGSVFKQGKRASIDRKLENGVQIYVLGKYLFYLTDWKRIEAD